jgi:hypothetical protein
MPAGTLFGTLTRVINVRDFGAVGDGETDDTEAIQAAIDAAITEYAPVILPASTAPYMITNLTLWAGTRIIGAHMRYCELRRISGSTGTAIREKTAAEGNVGATGIWLEHFTLNGDGTTGDGIDLGNQVPAAQLASQAGICNVRVTNFPSGIGFKLCANAASFYHLWADLCQDGIKTHSAGASAYHSVWIEQCTRYHLQVTDTGNMFYGIQIEDDNSGTNPCIRNESYDNLFDGIFISLADITKDIIIQNLGARAAYRGVFLLHNSNTYNNLIHHSTGYGTGSAVYHVHEFIVGETSVAGSYYVNGSTGNYNTLLGDITFINGIESGGIAVGTTIALLAGTLFGIRKSTATQHFIDYHTGGAGTYTGSLNQA